MPIPCRGRPVIPIPACWRAPTASRPQRTLWGSDWPHPTEKIKPDDAVLFDLLAAWAPDPALRHQILVSNPASLFGFS
jgi:predicted TIM-barrel fold metal-dependent hydrolase